MIASPKHPQSDTGLVMARMRVSGVKSAMNNNTPQVPNFGLNPKRRDIPKINSADERRMESGNAMGFRKSMPNATK
jgi:hypothetical protein